LTKATKRAERRDRGKEGKVATSNNRKPNQLAPRITQPHAVNLANMKLDLSGLIYWLLAIKFAVT
jgi:hypothetical protein